MAVLVATRSSGFVVRRLFGGFEVTSVWGVSVSGGVVVSRALLLRRQRFFIWKLHYSALVCVLRVKASAFFMEYCLVFHVLIVSDWHWRWSLSAQSIVLWFSKTSTVG
ncbi:hypothetical protein Bca52824_011614 [Brassica carinata]|uniref:Transmembrane protein n=1 Tax=Brassica carinata TaxID=52824 RepID=A0A8X7VVZ6_BRACI|nr:hypothetical protein Bca52824_011614 [Brassica carinata]